MQEIIVACLLHHTWVSKSLKLGTAKEAVGVMVKFKLICPDCDAVIMTSSAEALIWEACPACRRHRWDMGDIMMADVVADRNTLNKIGKPCNEGRRT